MIYRVTLYIMLHITKYISLPLFLLSFILGLLGVYIMGYGETRKIFVYPTPENVSQLQYRDANQTCYEATPKSIACPADRDQISKTHV